ncbi:MAG TPA: SCO family protein [Ktedonobacterales bacterium]|jgi:cytochrome oxidase Cu insertion factor (SCO1/SenC/PrrC family)
MRLRNISRLIVIVLVVLVGAVAIIHQRLTSDAAPAAPALVGGTALNDPVPQMSLRDQNGALVTTQSLSGRPTVLTFMDMTCTQECPIQAQLLNQTALFMGAQKASQVNWIVVSVNPNNTTADATAFMQKNKVTIPIKVLLGTQAQLEPVWHAYHIYVKATPTDVNHTVALFLIDKSGRQRMVFIDGFDPKALSQDLSKLLT